MKRQIYKSILWILPLFLGGWLNAQSNFHKEYHESFDAAKVDKLLLESKFGNATIKDNGSNTVTVDVVIEVKDVSEKTAERILDRINVEIELSGGALMVETHIESSGMSKGSYNITYDINIPKNRDVIAESKYGNLYIDELTGAGIFEIAYGNISGRNLTTNGELMLELSYGNAKFENINNALMEVKYSNVVIKEKAGNMVLEGKNSTYKINELKDLTMESKYDDLKIGSIRQLVIEMGYTNVEIGELQSTFVAETSYGNVNIQHISADFDKIAIESNYGDIKLGIDKNATYKVDMESDYGSIKVPESTRINKEKDQNSTHVYGIIGNGSAKSAVATSSKYGNVTILAE